MGRKRWVGWSAILVLAGLGVLAACVSAPRPGGSNGEETSSISEALTSSANLLLQEQTASCVANQAQDFFDVTNNGTTSVKVSDISIKLWVDDTTAQNIVGQINYGGCLTGATGCAHPVTGVTVTATHFTPACGTDPNHQADWELKISSTDTSTLAPGVSWANIQSAVHLANFANFSPGTADWYSPCVSGSSFVDDGHFAVYVAGNLVSASPGVPPSCRGTHGTTIIPGEVPPGLGSTYPLVGPLPGATVVSLAIGLPLIQLSNTPGLPDLPTFITQVSDPRSPTYRHYLTPAAFAAAYGPSTADYGALQTFATTNGLSVTKTYTSRDLLVVTGTAAAIENVFSVTLNLYQRPDGTVFYSTANDPSVSNLTLTNPILHVSGFDDFAVAHPASNTGAGTSTLTPDCRNANGFFGTDLRTIYAPCAAGQLGFSAAIEGAGQTVALFELDGYDFQDVLNYASGVGLGNPLQAQSGTTVVNVSSLLGSNVTQQLVPTSGTTAAPASFTGPGVGPGSGQSEVEVGMEMVLAMAPAAKIVVYEQNTTTSVGFQPNPVLQTIADQDVAQVVSNSWTWTGGTASTDVIAAQTFQQFAVQGQSFFQAAGDLGSYIAGSSGAINVPEPIIDSSLMTVVGGTEFTAGSETTWNDPSERTLGVCTPGPGQTLGDAVLASGVCNSVTGGGFATGYGSFTTLALPVYQVGLTNAEIAAGPTNTRMIPDVSILADDLATYFTVPPAARAPGCAHGTSASAALWAAYTALSNSSSSFAAPEGFANPELYFLATEGTFSDITTGNNNYTSSATSHYNAVTGYDLATGLGSPSQTQAACSTITSSLPVQSCMPGTSLSVLFQKPTGAAGHQNIVAYMPVGSYDEAATGVVVVPVESTAATALLTLGGTNPAVPDDVINTCGADAITGQVVCTSNGTTAYLITTDPTTALPTGTPTALTDSATPLSTAFLGEPFSGGHCATCNVAVDPLHGTAFLSIGQTPTVTGATAAAFFQPVNLAPGLTAAQRMGAPIPINQQATSEDVLVDPVRGFLLSPNEGPEEGLTTAGDYQLVNTSNGAVFDFEAPTGSAGDFDSAAEDCLTGVAMSTDEFTGNLFLVDLNQITFPTGGTTWTAPNQFFPIPEAGFLGAGTSGISVVASGSHVGAVAGEFGSDSFIAIMLPQSKATVAGTVPALNGWVQANIPASPDGLAWQMGDDPHTLTAYTSPNTNRQYAVFEDDVFPPGGAAQNGTRTWLAVVDLTAVLTTTTLGSGSVVGTAETSSADAHQPTAPLSCCHAPDPTTTANPAGCTVRFVCAQAAGCGTPVPGGC